MWKENREWKQGIMLKQGRGYALILIEENEHRWILRRRIWYWRGKNMIWYRPTFQTSDACPITPYIRTWACQDQANVNCYNTHLGADKKVITGSWEPSSSSWPSKNICQSTTGYGNPYHNVGKYSSWFQSSLLGIYSQSSFIKTHYIGRFSIPVFVNDSAWLPGPYDQSLPLKKEEGWSLKNYTVRTDSTSICIGFGEFCLKTGFQGWLSIVEKPGENKNTFFFLINSTYF